MPSCLFLEVESGTYLVLVHDVKPFFIEKFRCSIWKENSCCQSEKRNKVNSTQQLWPSITSLYKLYNASLRSAFETVQSTWFPFTFAFDGDFSLPLAFFTLFGQFLTYGDGFRVDDVFALFAEVSEWDEREQREKITRELKLL